ncbi:gamma-glutamyltransferase family protein [Svornostia abyssi]|uniref:Gamma-glutamyltransferase family protein n=2 Tax=Svornostia abyssi TaxID=2898438 RepID=A0ABY5PP70_9ACTN|nr:gamma-glutamyltransferase family protein [Parviterribacteraceae bacterium J379]
MRLGSTTHLSVVDRDGLACAVTCTNGEGAGVVVPGTGIHMNNIMGEEDLSPMGFHTAPAGRRMPSMMAPTVVARDGTGDVEAVLGSAGSNRIRSALLQTIVGIVDHGLDAQAAVDAPRAHYEGGVVYAEPGVPVGGDRTRGPGRGAVSRAQPLLRGRAGDPAHAGRRALGRRRPAAGRRGGQGLTRAATRTPGHRGRVRSGRRVQVRARPPRPRRRAAERPARPCPAGALAACERPLRRHRRRRPHRRGQSRLAASPRVVARAGRGDPVV